MAPKSKNFLNFIVSFLQRFLGFSCEAASPRLRASERASKQKTEGGMCGCGGVRQTARERGPGGEQSKGLGDGEGAGREGPGTEPQGPRAGRGEPGAGSREPGIGVAARRARSRAGCSRSSGSGVAEAERSAGPEPCAPGEASWAAGGEPPAAALEKAGSGGVATWCPRPPFPPSPL